MGSSHTKFAINRVFQVLSKRSDNYGSKMGLFPQSEQVVAGWNSFLNTTLTDDVSTTSQYLFRDNIWLFLCNI